MKAILPIFNLLLAMAISPVYAQSSDTKASRPDAKRIDKVKLANGDQITGRVLKLDGDTIVLESDALGKLALPRDQIAEIQMDVNRSKPTDQSNSERGQQPTQLRVPEATLIKELQARGLPIKQLSDLHRLLPDVKLPQSQDTPEDVIRRLRTEGISSAELDEVRANVPLLALPGARSYFDQTLQGLIAGRLDLHDIRQEAIKARDGLKDIQKDLGPDGAALNGYLMILEGFLKQTEASTTTEPRPEPSSS